MPHLSPLNWMTITVSFWITLLLFMTVMWWQQTPKFPKPKKNIFSLTKSWKWS